MFVNGKVLIINCWMTKTSIETMSRNKSGMAKCVTHLNTVRPGCQRRIPKCWCADHREKQAPANSSRAPCVPLNPCMRRCPPSCCSRHKIRLPSTRFRIWNKCTHFLTFLHFTALKKSLNIWYF